MVGISRNIQLRKETEKAYAEAIQRAHEASKAKSEFVARISHEIRTPLNAIIGMNYLLKQSWTDPVQESYLRKMELSAKNLLSIINDVLDLSKIESGKAEIVEMVTDLKQMEENLKMMLEYSIQKGMIDFKVEDQIENPLVWCDATKLQQVLVNVLNNAVKFTPAGGTITFSCVQRMIAPGFAEYKFTIKDTGIGMTEEFQKHAFDAFAQEGKQSTTTFSGSGLGLSIVKDIVERMGGTIELESEENVGSTFTVTVPFEIDYLVENKDRIQGIFLTHGHADAIGALPYILQDAKVPVFGSSLTIELAKLFVKNAGVNKFNNFHVIDSETEIEFDDAVVSFFKTTHSIPESMGIVLGTDRGNNVYTGDFKFDQAARPYY